MESESGQVFVKNLASFVRTHERALANALQLQRQRAKHAALDTAAAAAADSTATTTATSISLSSASTRPFLSFKPQNIKAAKLSLTPHHLYYLLSKFEDLGVDVGPMTVRLEDIHKSAPSEYMSFLGSAPKSKGKQTDSDSLKSVSSIRSVVSTVSSLWSNLSLAHSTAKAEKQLAQHKDDIRYLYSCFTKIPALRLSPDKYARLIEGYELQPFDTAVPLFAFKNVSSLEICDLDFRQFHGWDKLSQNLRSLTVKRANVEDPTDLLLNIVLDDTVGRRTRSSKAQMPTTPSTPSLVPWPFGSPKLKQADVARSLSTPDQSLTEQNASSPRKRMTRGGSIDESNKMFATPVRKRSNSPNRPSSSQHGSINRTRRRGQTVVYRRSSGSSGSSTHETTPRHSTSDLLFMGITPTIQWTCLRHLSLAENGLTSLSPKSLSPVAETLQSLDLSGNLFSEIPDVSILTHLRALNMSNCMIASLKSLVHTPLPAVTTVNLRANRLRQLVGVERLPSLERIDLRDNRLADPQELARLTGLPNIADLYVAKNPFVKTFGDFRIIIFNLFRRAPGYTEDITIDSFGPLYNEKKHLDDRAPEAANIPVIKPPTEDEDEELPATTSSTDVADSQVILPPLEMQENPWSRRSHLRTTSDVGPDQFRHKRKSHRRRIVELSNQELSLPTTRNPTSEAADISPVTPFESDGPATPETVPFHTAKTTQVPPRSVTPPERPGLHSAFTTPTPAPRNRLSVDEDESPVRSGDQPQDSAVATSASPNLYRQKMETLKHDMGPEWLAALGDARYNNDTQPRSRNQGNFSPSSRSEAILRAGAPAHREISIGGRTLG
ncbi:Hypothetical protein R9X50_00085000 [Acrodontium crateriforme]|uniref:Leucine rich repeat domain-containing protein n=1 Tax=Acrodontium crateriforme TaxID=150365 RepID=A0AAQ3R7D0_9PEZI|nr:Hypothetical protein R9X50_00085000 [Acrodontium crateriforme]